MTQEMESAAPAQVEQTEQDAQVEQQASTEATAEQTAEQTETQEDKAKREPWFQKRIGELTREKYEARRAEAEAKQVTEQYKAYLEQLQQGQAPQAKPEVDVMTLAEQKAAQLVAERTFNEQCNKVYADGAKEFPDFDAAVRNLQMVGVNRDFLELAASSDAGHKVLHHLGTDLDEAARILSLPPVQMARELTRLEIKLAQPQAKPVSKAPAPVKPIGSGGAPEGLRDDLPPDEWLKRRNKQLYGR